MTISDFVPSLVTTPNPALELEAARTKIANLEVALRSSRMIGMAIGIVMERCKISEDEAFALLVHVSQHTHRKLRDLASELVFTGVIPHDALR
jgi:AmiR/NasT family two-component response regulator